MVYQVELSVAKIYCISKSLCLPPFHFEDAVRSYKESKEASDVCLSYSKTVPSFAPCLLLSSCCDFQNGKKLPDVALDIRLNNRSFDLRTPANQAIFRIQSVAESVSVVHFSVEPSTVNTSLLFTSKKFVC